MKVAILTVGSRGDVQPFLAFGAGLRAAGHDVRICTHPVHRDLVEGRGIEFAPLAQGALGRRWETEEGRRWAEHGSRRMPGFVGLIRDARSVARERLWDAAAGCEGADVVVASNLMQVLGWQVSRELGIPLVRTLLNAPAYWMSQRSRPVVAGALRQAAWLGARPWLNRVRRDALGLGPLPLRQPMGQLDREGRLVLYPFSPAVFPKPPEWGPGMEVTGYWFLDDALDPDPPEELRAFLEAGPPPVYVGFGIQIDHDPPHTTAIIVEALRRAGRRGVIQRPPEALAGAALGDDVLAIERVSHAWLFPRCAAVVHHGAAGTTATGLRAGVPAVVVPHHSDQSTWGKRLAQLGVSPPPIPRRRLTADLLSEAIAVATADAGMRQRAQELGARIREEDGVARAVEAFERHVGGRGDGQPPLLFVNGFHRSGTTVLTSAVTDAVGGVTTTAGVLARHIPTLAAFFETAPNGATTRGADRLEATPRTVEEYGYLLQQRTGEHALYGHPDNLRVLREHIAELAAEHPGATIVLKNPWDMGREAQLLADFPGARIVILRRRLADIERSGRRAVLGHSTGAYSRAVDGDGERYHQLQRLLASPWKRPLLLWGLRLAVRRQAFALARSVERLPADRVALLSFDEFQADPRAGAAWAAHLLDPDALAEAFARHAFTERLAPAPSSAVHRALDRRWARAWERARAAQVRAGIVAPPSVEQRTEEATVLA